MANWFAPTHHDHLVKHYGLDPATMPFVDCACGLKNRRADYMIDVTGLPAHVRAALGIGGVDYLCDGCTTRLFRENHISQEDFNFLLGAPDDNLALVRPFDAEHQRGIANRPLHKRPTHRPVTRTLPVSSIGLASTSETVQPTLPLQRRTLTHADSAAKLMQQGVIPNTNPTPTLVINP